MLHTKPLSNKYINRVIMCYARRHIYILLANTERKNKRFFASTGNSPRPRPYLKVLSTTAQIHRHHHQRMITHSTGLLITMPIVSPKLTPIIRVEGAALVAAVRSQTTTKRKWGTGGPKSGAATTTGGRWFRSRGHPSSVAIGLRHVSDMLAHLGDPKCSRRSRTTS
jgi:hypothetical protein